VSKTDIAIDAPSPIPLEKNKNIEMNSPLSYKFRNGRLHRASDAIGHSARRESLFIAPEKATRAWSSPGHVGSGRESAFGGVFIDSLGQFAAKQCDQFFSRQSCLFYQGFHGLGANRLLEL
jgi:hypothetical protein